MNDGDDVVTLGDLRERVAVDGEVTVPTGRLVAVVVALLAVGLTLGVVVHTPMVVGPEVVDEDGGETTDLEDPAAVMRNASVWWFGRLAPGALAAVAAPVAFVVARGRRDAGSVAVALAGGVGSALAYAAFVSVAHHAYAPTAPGLFVDHPARLDAAALAWNAGLVAVGGTAAAGAALLARWYAVPAGAEEPSRSDGGSRSATTEDA